MEKNDIVWELINLCNQGYSVKHTRIFMDAAEEIQKLRAELEKKTDSQPRLTNLYRWPYEGTG